MLQHYAVMILDQSAVNRMQRTLIQSVHISRIFGGDHELRTTTSTGQTDTEGTGERMIEGQFYLVLQNIWRSKKML